MVKCGLILLLADTAVRLEDARGGEFTELVADHVLSYINRSEALAVMYIEGEADEIRNDHGGAAPGLDRLAVPALKLGVNLVEKRLAYEGSFFEGTSHC